MWAEEKEPVRVMTQTVRSSEAIDAISEALVRAQGKFEAAVKDSANPAYRSKYADLNSVLGAVRKPLNEEGIAIIQPASLDGQMVTVTTRLQHKSGQYFESSLTLPAVQRDRFDAQSVGSAITYGRRYGLQSMTGIGAEDDDGNSASGVGSREAAQEVGRKKVEELKAKHGWQEVPSAQPSPVLFYTYPTKHNNNFAEWINVKEFTANLDGVAAEGLRQVFKPFVSKQLAKTGAVMVPRENMQPLLEKLAGECGVNVKELAAND